MMGVEEMVLRLAIAILLGALIGLERTAAGKAAGIRTDMMVAAGAAIFSIVGLELPYVVSQGLGNVVDVVAQNAGFLNVIANIVVGVGFLGAGIIVHEGLRVRGLTTAATVWFVAAIGILVGIGLITFALIAALGVTALLWILRKFNVRSVVGDETYDDTRPSD